jgi:hypothetical protein
MAAPRRHAYMLPMSIRSVLLIVVLLALLIAAAAISIHTWNSIGADPSAGGQGMSGVGIAALIGGGLGTLALGVGLMSLVFFSARRGYDDAADQKARPPEDL